jgi:excisionase family DNA binding protein
MDIQNVEKNEEWLTTEEAAAFLKIGVATLRNMTSNGHVPYYKLGRRNRYLKSELHKMMLSEKRGLGALEEQQKAAFASSYPALARRQEY